MMDDHKKHKRPAAREVNIHDVSAVAFWCGKWGCSETELKTAVRTVGAFWKDVETFLRQKGQIRVASTLGNGTSQHRQNYA